MKVPFENKIGTSHFIYLEKNVENEQMEVNKRVSTY